MQYLACHLSLAQMVQYLTFSNKTDLEWAKFYHKPPESYIIYGNVKQVFLKILQISYENICVGVSFNKVVGLPVLESLFKKVVALRPRTFSKRDSSTGAFLRNVQV